MTRRNGPETQALVPVVPGFELAPEEARRRFEEFVAFVRDQMIEDVDYGVIPGTGPRPTLLKPGAEKLCNLFGLAVEQAVTHRLEDWDRPIPLFVYEVETTLRALRTGLAVAHGLGSCNSRESKYRWREARRRCPTCTRETIILSKAEYGGGWLCFRKLGGCGSKFPANAQAILQGTGRVENEDVADQQNTILKMAAKRSLVDAVLKATRASGIFTQDVEDLGAAPVNGEVVEADASPEPAPASPVAPTAPPAKATSDNHRQQELALAISGASTNAQLDNLGRQVKAAQLSGEAKATLARLGAERRAALAQQAEDGHADIDPALGVIGHYSRLIAEAADHRQLSLVREEIDTHPLMAEPTRKTLRLRIARRSADLANTDDLEIAGVTPLAPEHP